MKSQMAPIGAHAAWHMGQWEEMAGWVAKDCSGFYWLWLLVVCCGKEWQDRLFRPLLFTAITFLL